MPTSNVFRRGISTHPYSIYVMGKINILPSPLHIPHGVIPRHSTRPQARDRASRQPTPQKEVPRRREEEELPKRATCSGERMVKKATTRSPPTTSPSNQDSKRFEEELAKAMDMSRKEMKKGDKEELLQLKKYLKRAYMTKSRRP